MRPEHPVAIVTGAAGAIGSAVSTRLAADGFAVGVLDLEEASAQRVVDAVEASGGRAVAVAADVSNEQAVEHGVSLVVEALGAPTVLVNNAGVIRDNLLFKMTLAQWEQVMSVHMTGAFLMSRATQRHMVEAGWGRIVNLSSTSALGNRGQSNYAAAKAGLQGFTKTLALELGKFGVTVNAIAPGFIESEMTALAAQQRGMSFEDFKVESAANIAVGRVGQPEDVAATVSFFVREEASFVSGQVIYLAGGPRA